jgi:hypothetical protein
MSGTRDHAISETCSGTWTTPPRSTNAPAAISLQSVYDALGVLVAEELIRRIQPAGSSARFEDRVGCRNDPTAG